MNRRDFIFKSSLTLLFTSSPRAMASIGTATPGSLSFSKMVQDLRAADAAKNCQLGGDETTFENAARLINPAGERGLWAHSIGCHSPHKHLIFVPERYLLSPELVSHESDAVNELGQKAKTFLTSPAYDMSTVIRLTVGEHHHELLITQSDIEEMLMTSGGVEKIAFQDKFPFGGKEPGHLFVLDRNSIR